MNRRLVPVIFGLMLAVAPGATAAGPSSKPIIESGNGCLKAPGATSCEAFQSGATFVTGAELQAGDKGIRVRFPEGTLELWPGATLKLSAPMPVTIGPGAPVRAQVLQFSSGLAAIKVTAGKQKGAVLVRGAHQMAAIVTGDALISSKADSMAIVNQGGKLLATASNSWAELPLQKVRTITKDEAKPSYHDLLPAPVIQPSQQASTTAAPASEQLSVAWAPVPGAAGYDLLLARVGDAAPPTRFVAQATDRSRSFGRLPPGDYEVRVRAIDPDDLHGAEGPPVGLTMATIDLPPGGFISSPGVVQLADEQSITLGFTSNLEVAFDVGTEFSAAPRTFPMRNSTPRTLRLRRRGGSTETSVHLEPRSLGADIDIGPKKARWPKDSVSIQIRLINRTGGAIPPGVKLVPEVKIGLTPLAVEWQGDGLTLRGVIPPQPQQGPTVVRVEVKDQNGIFLGRNFLEIVSYEAPAH
jgi:hypothetical protein